MSDVMPRPTPARPDAPETAPPSAGRHRLPYLPALDGLRAVALLAVLGFHAEVSWLKGGYLPLTAFFVLSGFLVTSLLLIERDGEGRVRLAAFWGRRARRLAPAALLGLVVAAAFVRFTGGHDLDRLRGDALSSLLWVTNWRFVFSDQSYADIFSDPSPLTHYWSLAVEEQFYLVLPLLVVVVGLVAGARRRWVLGAVAASLAVASTATMIVLHQPGDEPLRTYYGSDTRAAELLVGVVLATILCGRAGLRRFEGAARRAVDIAGATALTLTVGLWIAVREYDDWLFEGGLLLTALLAAAVVTAGTQPGTVVSRVLSARPLVDLGRISYGVYILHWPVFLWLSPERTGLEPWPLLSLRLTVVIGAAALSWNLLERPIRYGRFPRMTGPVAWANGIVAVAAVVVVATTASTVAPLTTLRAEGEAAPPPPPPAIDVTQQPAGVTGMAPGEQAAGAPEAASGQAAAPSGAAPGSPAGPPTTTVVDAEPGVAPPPAAPEEPTPPTRVLVVGDSLAQNLATGLTRWGDRTGAVVVWDYGLSGCPLSRGGERRTKLGPYPIHDNCDWWGDWDSAMRIAEFMPDVVLIVAGFNDLFDRKLPEWPHYRRPGDPVFDSWLISEYNDALDVFGSGGAPLVWAPPPCLHWESWEAYIEPNDGETRRIHHNRVLFESVRTTRAVEHADLEEQLCPDGRYERDALGYRNSRPDGVHLTDEASEALAERWLGPLLIAAAERG